MTRYLCIHTLPPNAMTRPQMEQLAWAMQHDPQVRGYRSFACLSQGKVACIVEAPSQQAVASWFKDHGVPVDSITPLEIEGERGLLQDLQQQQPSSGLHA